MNIFKIIKQFPTQQSCLDYLAKKRWRNKPVCPYCGSTKVYKHKEKNKTRFQCDCCHKSFTSTVGTIFHNSHIPLQKWFLIISMMLNAKKGISSYQIARDLEMRQGTVWSIMQRIRKAMIDDDEDDNDDKGGGNNKIDTKLLKGIVELDETYIGGKADNMHMEKRVKAKGIFDKSAIFGMIERKGKVKAEYVNDTTAKTLLKAIYTSIEPDSLLITDEAKQYQSIGNSYIHRTVNHSNLEFVKNGMYKNKEISFNTNSIEGFWALIKRGLIGQFHHISNKYLQKYIDEFCWRFNNRNSNNTFDKLINNCIKY